MQILEAAGYSCTRAAASLGLFDIIALNARQIRLIQVKTNRNAPPAEREAMELFDAPPNATKEIWIFHDYKKIPVISLL
ncbi:MAG TPA: hypothetical protein VEA41_20300 [Salinarimonas sp.]|nr:hypothetical protein [Salinarimonas sp.]